MANEFIIRVSDDQGNTWTIVKNDTEGYFPVGRQDLSGRIWIFYYRENKIYYDFTNDQGATWNGEAEVILETGEPPVEVVPAEGKIGLDIDSTGKMWISFWDSEDKVRSAYTLFQKYGEGHAHEGEYIWIVGTIS